MNFFQAIILGLVQGLTEFLPVSSSGHLVLVQKLFNINTDVMTFDLAVHFATLIAVAIVFWKDIWEMIKRPFSKLTLMVVVGTIPAVILGLLLKDFFEDLFISGSSLGFEFLLTGAVLIYAERIKNRKRGLAEMNYKDAALVGLAQAVAILPAVSRSGLTLAGGLFRGLSREFALRFSFLLSIPAILGPVLLDLVDVVKGQTDVQTGIEPMAMVFGMLAAAASGYLAIRFMLKIFTKWSLNIFAYYVFVLGALVLADQFIFGIFFDKLF